MVSSMVLFTGMGIVEVLSRGMALVWLHGGPGGGRHSYNCTQILRMATEENAQLSMMDLLVMLGSEQGSRNPHQLPASCACSKSEASLLGASGGRR